MRKIAIGVLLAILVMTAGVYAASMSGTTKRLGGTGSTTVDAPSAAATLGWGLNSTGDVITGDVSWTPVADSDYTILVRVGGVTGTGAITTSGTSFRTDSITKSPSVASDSITAAIVVISED